MIECGVTEISRNGFSCWSNGQCLQVAHSFVVSDVTVLINSRGKHTGPFIPLQWVSAELLYSYVWQLDWAIVVSKERLMMIAVGILWMRGLLIRIISIVNWLLEIIYIFRRGLLRVCTVLGWTYCSRVVGSCWWRPAGCSICWSKLLLWQ